MIKKQFSIIILLITFSILLAGCNKNINMNKAMGSGTLITTSSTEKEISEDSKKDSTEDKLKDNEIAFSEKGYFYSEDINLKINSTKKCTIYYTTDGTNPDKKKTLYKNEIKLTAKDELNAVSIKAKAYFEDGTESATIVHSYFLGKNVKSRFDTLVFSITTDPYNLFDYKYGIFVTGKIRDDYIKEHPGEKIDPASPANYNMRGKDSERPVYLEILEPNGTKIADNAAGIRTYGGWSRDNKQKPIKIFTRKEYDKDNNKLRYDFFPQKTAANGDGTILDTFNRLVLRNCGNDNGIAFIRDELFETLAGQAGYADYEAVRPAALFINGEYRGFYWLHENYCDEYFKQNYGDYKGNFEILEGEETVKTLDDDEGNKKTVEEYEKMYSKYSKMDLTNDKNYKALCKVVDVENYLSYFALQTYIGNGDWPNNNYKTYRYYTTKGEKYGKAPFDGKWRYLLHDLDFSFAIYGKSASFDDITNYVGSDGEIKDACPLFGQLMRRKDCREIFIKKTVDLINGAFSPDNISKVMTKMNNERANEIKNTFGKGILSNNWAQYTHLEGRLNDIVSFGVERAEHVLKQYQDYFNLDDIYQLRADPVKGCELKINSYLTDKYFEGKYYSDYNTKISAVLPAGEELDYWLCNGEKVYDKELTITSKNIKGGEVAVTFMLKETNKDAHLIINELSDEKNMIELYNPYKDAVSMEDYTLSDDTKNIKKLVMPVKTIAPGEKYQVFLKKADSKNDKSSLYIKIKDGNTINLYRKGIIIDKVKIPNVKKENVYRRDLSTLRFYEVKQ